MNNNNSNNSDYDIDNIPGIIKSDSKQLRNQEKIKKYKRSIEKSQGKQEDLNFRSN